MGSFVELRNQRLRSDIYFGRDRCMEIGALVHPVLLPQDKNVFYTDHLSTEGLKKQFAWDKDFPVDQLMNVDFVWDNKQPLKKCVDGKFDYVVASHVGEHVPNLIEWIEQIRQVLTPNGQLRLALPDGRYSFDMKRQETRLADLLGAWMKKVSCPETHLVLDFALNKVNDEAVANLHIRDGVYLNAEELDSQFPFNEVLEWGERTLNPTHYEDVHCWVLSLNLFAKYMMILSKYDIMKMSCVKAFDIEPENSSYEFMVFMSPEDDREKRVRSWEEIYNNSLQYARKYVHHSVLHQLEQENHRLSQEVQSIYNSSSWRITAPLRAIVKRFKR